MILDSAGYNREAQMYLEWMGEAILRSGASLTYVVIIQTMPFIHAMIGSQENLLGL